jgi:hypothetical protein
MAKSTVKLDEAEKGRVAACEDAFLTPSGEVDGLRAFSIGTFLICQKMGLTMFTGEATELAPEEQMRQLIALAWAQSAPLDEVRAAVRAGAEVWTEAVELWQFGLAPQVLPRLVSEIERLGRQAAAAAVDVEAQPDDAAGAAVGSGSGSRRKPRGKS